MEFSNLCNDSFWENLRTLPECSETRDNLQNFYNINCTVPTPDPSYSEYKLFYTTGNRHTYESKYFARRRKLASAAIMSKLYPDDNEYFEVLEDVIWEILNEYSWVLPAHMPQGADHMINNNIDLFSSETGYTLAEIKSMFKERFSPLILNRITSEINRRITEPFCRADFGWERGASNWAAVCAGSVGITLMYEAPDVFCAVKPRIDNAMAAFLSSYMDDGVCREGMSYWSYGFGYFTYYAAHLYEFTNGKENLFANPKTKTIAQFQQNMYLNGNILVSFADGSENGSTFCSGLTYYLKNIYPDIEIPQHAKNELLDGCARWGELSFALLFENFNQKASEEKISSEILFKDSNWFIKRNELYGFAAKGGDNGEPHNHNDLGSFIIASDNSQLLCDLGCGEYTRQYFTKERYKILCNSSLGHSVPIVNGEEQLCDEFTGYKVCANLSRTNEGIEIDLTNAYPEKDIKNIKRFFTFDEKQITMCDTFSFNSEVPVTERFVSRIKPQISDGILKLNNLSLICENADFKITEQIHSEHNTQKTTVYLIDFELTPSTENTFKIKFSFE